MSLKIIQMKNTYDGTENYFLYFIFDNQYVKVDDKIKQMIIL